MPEFLFCTPSENVAPAATIVGTVEDVDYPAANLIDRIPGKPAKLTGTSGSWVLTFDPAQRVDVAMLVHANLDAGLSVRIQANNGDNWLAPMLDTAIVIPAWHEDGFPQNPYVDLTGVAGYTAAGFTHFRLRVVGINSVPISIGELLLWSRKRQFRYSIKWGSTRTEEWPLVVHETDMRVRLKYGLGAKVRGIAGTMEFDEAGEAAFEALIRDARGALKPFPIVPDTSVNDAWFVDFVNPQQKVVRVTRGHYSRAVEFVEVSRGLAP